MAEEVQADLVQIGSKKSKLTSEEEGLTGNKSSDLAVDRGAWREMTALCTISTGETKV